MAATTRNVLKHTTGNLPSGIAEDDMLQFTANPTGTPVVRTIAMPPANGTPGKMMVQSAKGTYFLEATEANLRKALDGATYMNAGGGLIQLPAAEIDIPAANGTLSVPYSVEIRGVGVGGTVIKMIDVASPANYPDVFRCLPQSAVAPVSGQGLQRFVGLTITRSTVVNGPNSPVTGCGIDTNGVHSPYIDRCSIVNQYAGIINRSTSPDDTLKYTRDMQIVNSGIGNCAAYGLKLDLPAPNPHTDWGANCFYMTNGAIYNIWNVGADPASGTGVRINTFAKQNFTEGAFLLSTTMSAFALHGVWVTGSNFYMQNVQVTKSNGHGLFLDRCRHATIIGCEFALNGIVWHMSPPGPPTFNGNFDGIRVENATTASTMLNANISLLDNLVMQNGGNGIRVRNPSAGQESGNVRIENNLIHSNGMDPAMAGSAIKVSIGSVGDVPAGTSPFLMVVGNRTFNDPVAIADTNSLFGTSFSLTPEKYGLVYETEEDSPPGPPPNPDGWVVVGNAFYHDATHSQQLNGASMTVGAPPMVNDRNN